MDDKYRSRKFLLAVSSLILGSAFLVAGLLKGSEWIILIGLILGLYGGSNVMEKK